jgi:hypothetical protein
MIHINTLKHILGALFNPLGENVARFSEPAELEVAQELCAIQAEGMVYVAPDWGGKRSWLNSKWQDGL